MFSYAASVIDFLLRDIYLTGFFNNTAVNIVLYFKLVYRCKDIPLDKHDNGAQPFSFTVCIIYT